MFDYDITATKPPLQKDTSYLSPLQQTDQIDNEPQAVPIMHKDTVAGSPDNNRTAPPLIASQTNTTQTPGAIKKPDSAPMLPQNSATTKPKKDAAPPIIQQTNKPGVQKAAGVPITSQSANQNPHNSFGMNPPNQVAVRDGQIAAAHDKLAVEAMMSEFVPTLGRVNTEGTHVRNEKGGLLATLSYNTPVLAIAYKPGNSLKVTLDNNITGWVVFDTISLYPPGPNSKLYKIEQNEPAGKIVDKFYGGDYKWGWDRRFYENVLVYVNRPNGFHKRKKEPGIYKNGGDITTRAGYSIWVPSREEAKALHGVVSSGSFTYEAVDTAELVAGFGVGLLHGALQSIIDIFVGLYELIKIILKFLWSYLTGQLISDAISLAAKISHTDFKVIIDKETKEFTDKWNSPDSWIKGHFRGYVIGYAIMEIITIIFSIGAVEVIKYVGKLGKFTKIAEGVEKFSELTKLSKYAEDTRLKTPEKDLEKLENAVKKDGKLPEPLPEKPKPSSGPLTNRSGNPEDAAKLAREHPHGLSDTEKLPATKDQPHIEEVNESGGKKGDWNKTLNKELKPNTIYNVDGMKFKTDEFGRVKEVEVDSLLLQKRGRNTYQQGKSVTLKDGVPGQDEGGHLIGDRFFGPSEQINYHAMDEALNQGAWKRIENEWATALKAGKDVKNVKIKANFEGASKRPVSFEVDYTIGDLKKSKFFDN